MAYWLKLEVNFCDANMKELSTVVIIGVNGAGKTTLLKGIFEFMNAGERDFKSDDGIIENTRGRMELNIRR